MNLVNAYTVIWYAVRSLLQRKQKLNILLIEQKQRRGQR